MTAGPRRARYGGTPALYLLGEDRATARTGAAPLLELRRAVRAGDAAANMYHALGLTPGAAVALMLPTVHDPRRALGAQAAGIANPVNPMLAPEHIAAILARTKAQILLPPGVAGP